MPLDNFYNIYCIFYNLYNIYCIVLSSFGIATFNIDEITLQSLLKLLKRDKNYCEIKGQILFHGVKSLIIDETLVIGQNICGWIDKWLHQITGKLDVESGGISIMLVVDFAQLLQITDKPQAITDLWDTWDIEVWQLLLSWLKIKVFLPLIRKDLEISWSILKNGDNTLGDWVLYCSHNFSKFNVSFINGTPVRLANTNLFVAENSYSMLMPLNISVYKVVHNSSKAAKLSTGEFGGLQQALQLSVGARVMLLLNFWAEVGLCNGAMGEISEIL